MNKKFRTASIGLVSNQNCEPATAFPLHPRSPCPRPFPSTIIVFLALPPSCPCIRSASHAQCTDKTSRELRLELRVSETRIRDFEYPAFFPSPPQSLSSQGETAWYFYLAEIALQRLKSRILYHTYYHYSDAPSSINTDLILNFEHQAKEW
jgi:hypothetical protein